MSRLIANHSTYSLTVLYMAKDDDNDVWASLTRSSLLFSGFLTKTSSSIVTGFGFSFSSSSFYPIWANILYTNCWAASKYDSYHLIMKCEFAWIFAHSLAFYLNFFCVWLVVIHLFEFSSWQRKKKPSNQEKVEKEREVRKKYATSNKLLYRVLHTCIFTSGHVLYT